MINRRISKANLEGRNKFLMLAILRLEETRAASRAIQCGWWLKRYASLL